MGNFYHSTWVDAIAGGNPFNAIRLYWQMHPERDQSWYDQMASASVSYTHLYQTL